MAYAGSRLEEIENDVKFLFNDESGRFFTQAHFIRCANFCLRDLAKHGLLTKEGSINSVAGTYHYDLQAAFSDFVDVNTVRWHSASEFMNPCRSMEHFDAIRISNQSGYVWIDEGPLRYFVESDTLYMWPAPTGTVTGGIVVRYRYTPPVFNLTDSCTPPTPRAWDDLYVEKILSDLYERRTGDAQAKQSAADHLAKYEMKVRKLQRQRKSPGQGISPYR